MLPEPLVDELREVSVDEVAAQRVEVRHAWIAAVLADELPERGMRDCALEMQVQLDLWEAFKPVAPNRQIDVVVRGHALPSPSDQSGR